MAKQKKRDIFQGFLLGAMVLYLIFDSRRAAAAGQAGILLCLRTVVPSLFPFFVLSRLLAASPLTGELSRRLGPVMEGLFHLPGAAAPALVLGALGGYPTGAQTAAELCRTGQITREEGERLLAFCSNAGPGFVFGMLGALFGVPLAGLLFCTHILSALLTGVLLRGKKGKHTAAPFSAPPSMNFPAAVRGSISAMAAVCANVVLFQIVADAFSLLGKGYLPDVLLLLLNGMLELTGGCAALAPYAGSPLGLCMAGFFLSFGGLCVWFQTKSVIAPAGLTGMYYLKGKLLQGTLTALMLYFAGLAFPGLLAVETAAVPGNHQGLLAATAWVAGAFFLFFLLWALLSRKRAGKMEKDLV